MKKLYRVKKNRDIEKILKARLVKRTQYFKVYKKQNPNQLHFRFAVSVSKKTGNAVLRNKMKRRLRMIISTLKIKNGFDIFIIVNQEAASLNFEILSQELIKALKLSNLLEVKE